MYDIFYISKDKDTKFLELQKRIPLLKIARYNEKVSEGFYSAQKKSLSKFFWVIDEDAIINEDFDFGYEVPEWDEKYIHVFKKKNGIYGGLYLIPKNYKLTQKEVEYNFFVNRKDIDIVFGSALPFEKFIIDEPEDFFKAQAKSTTPMFFAIDKDYTPVDTFDFDFPIPEWDRKYVHVFKRNDGNLGGMFLIPKDYPITKREAEYHFFVNKKEVDTIACKINYDTFNGLDFSEAQQESKTSMFYVIDNGYELVRDLDYIVPAHDSKYVHVFKNTNGYYEGVYLLPKSYPITKREAQYSFFINKKEIDTVVGKQTMLFDIVFVSYNEPNADENYENLLERFPQAKRVHGIKGIHQAHIEAAKLAETKMFWVVDGDALIEDNFNFDMFISKWDQDTVHVFHSRNPINDLAYGYGGVKLLPTKLVLEMDVNSVDMTTSISEKFKSVDAISNSTVFNTDPFNTWKSAFRECVKLSSKVIDGQIDDETQSRLDIWCTVGADRLFGENAIKGAIAGRDFGTKYADDKEMLKKINDWDWLQNEFRQ